MASIEEKITSLSVEERAVEREKKMKNIENKWKNI